MFPNAEFLGLDLYWWMIILGIIVAMVMARMLHERAGVSFGIFRFAIIVLVGSVFVGYVFAVLFQSWYNYLATGVFAWGVGATFYGGLIGSVTVFVAGYFGIGHFVFKDKRHIREFNRVLSLFMPCVAIAHGFGRFGCLFDGCCYGMLTDSGIGINMFIGGEWQKRVPIQLFEALYLFAMFIGIATLLVKKKCEYTTSIYVVAYAVWRFFIEYARDDVRGSSGIPFLTPSQLTAIIMIILGVGFGFLYKYVLKKLYASAGGGTEQYDRPAVQAEAAQSGEAVPQVREPSQDTDAQPVAGEDNGRDDKPEE